MDLPKWTKNCVWTPQNGPKSAYRGMQSAHFLRVFEGFCPPPNPTKPHKRYGWGGGATLRVAHPPTPLKYKEDKRLRTPRVFKLLHDLIHSRADSEVTGQETRWRKTSCAVGLNRQ